jgi:outer membrane protein
MERLIRWAVPLAVLPMAALAATVPGVARAQGAPKFAYVNSQAIFEQAPGRAEAEAQYKKEMTGYSAEMDRMRDSLNALLTSYGQQESSLTAAQKQSRQEEIRSRQDEYQKRAQELEQKASDREAELMRPIMQQVQKIIEDIRSEGGYSIIFDAGSNGGVIVAADKNLDITQKVIDRLQASAKPTAQQPAPAAKQPAPSGVTRPAPKKP